jgi:predicted aldo/keto reductase-like oxidoreductase
MQYRRFGKTGLSVSAIGLGTEYLINLPQKTVIEVIHQAISQGINYFDLFFAQPQFRDNMGAAFKGYRSQVILAAHLGAIDSNGQYDRTRDPKTSENFFFDFLARFETTHTDILYIHNIDTQRDYDIVFKPGGLVDVAERFRQEGKTRYIGLSGHTVATSLQAVESGRIDVLMFPINMASHAIPGKNELFAACATRKIGLVAMKPFAGGKLLLENSTLDISFQHTGGPPLQFEKPASITPIQCISYVLEQTGVSTVVPGCKDINQLSDTLSYRHATEAEKDFTGVLSNFQQHVTGECVYCNHCLPCPSYIDIGQTIRLLDMAQVPLRADLQASYDALPNKASDCIQCDLCTERCPYDVDVIYKMEQADKIFS